MLKSFLPALLFLSVFSCTKEVEVAAPTPETTPDAITDHRVAGFVQKGPYLNGTAMDISEMDEHLVPTGKTFTTRLLDNRGSFEINGLTVTSPYVQLRADGFYFNEVTNEKSSAQLTLFALADLRPSSTVDGSPSVGQRSSVNVNLLTSLEKARVEYLVGTGLDFAAAKKQALQELLDIFLAPAVNVTASEQLDISANGEDHAILLAISMILQADLEIAEFSEFLANISTDIRQDGTLDSQTLRAQLLHQAHAIDAEQIKANLTERYNDMGFAIEVPDFKEYVDGFITNTSFEANAEFEYPAVLDAGHDGQQANILFNSDDTLYTNTTYSLMAVLPEYARLRVEMKGGISGGGRGPTEYIPRWVQEVTKTGANWWDYDVTMTADEAGLVNYAAEFHTDSIAPPSVWNNVSFELYENDEETPTWSKQFTIVEQ